MGIVYSALVAAAPNNEIMGKTLTYVNTLVNGYHLLLTPVYYLTSSSLLQGAYADSTKVLDLYMKNVFPYVTMFSILCIMMSKTPPNSEIATRYQIRASMDEYVYDIFIFTQQLAVSLVVIILLCLFPIFCRVCFQIG